MLSHASLDVRQGKPGVYAAQTGLVALERHAFGPAGGDAVSAA